MKKTLLLVLALVMAAGMVFATGGRQGGGRLTCAFPGDFHRNVGPLVRGSHSIGFVNGYGTMFWKLLKKTLYRHDINLTLLS